MDEYYQANILGRALSTFRRASRKGWHDLKYASRKHEAFASQSNGTRAKVTVVGSGMSGLATALQLQLRGHEVTILEAAAQIGGRASTIREMFSDGLYADAGGFRFAADHFLMREYIAHFELPVQPFYPRSGDKLLYIDGELIRRRSGDPVDPDILPRPLKVEETWMLDQETKEHMYRICGGVDRLVTAMADRLNGKVQLHSEVRRIDHSETGIKIEYCNDGETAIEQADFAVCATPFSALRNIAFGPPLTEAKHAIIDSLEYWPTMLIYMAMPSEYWIEQDLSGFAVTDTVGELWTYGLNNRSGECVTIAYTKDDAARELIAMSQD